MSGHSFYSHCHENVTKHVSSNYLLIKNHIQIMNSSIITGDAQLKVVLSNRTPVVMTGEPVRMIEAVREGDAAVPNRFEIRVLREGVSKNGVNYGKALLKESRQMFDGANVFALSDTEHQKVGPEKQDVNKKIGRLSNTRFVETPLGAELRSTLTVLPSTGWSARFSEAIDLKMPDMFGAQG